MKKVVLTKEMFQKDYDELTEEEQVNLEEVIYDEFKYSIDRDLYYNHIELPIIDENGLTINIEKIDDYNTKDVVLSYDFNVEYGVLLTLATDLDYACYNSDIELWNAICTNDDLINHDNVMDIYSESIFFLFSDVENAIYNSEKHFLSDDELSYFVDDYKYKDLVDTDELLNYLSLSINELDKWINRELDRFFTDELNDMYMDSYSYIYDYVSELVENDNVVEFSI